MSRGFGTTLGTGLNSDFIPIRVPYNFATQISCAMWVYVNGLGGLSAGSLIVYVGGSPFFAINLSADGNPSDWRISTPWSGAIGSYRCTSPVGFGAWQHMVFTYDASSTANAPVVYINGVKINVTTATTASGSYGLSPSAARIGNNTVANNGFDGMIAHYAFWNGVILDQGSAVALAAGASPLFIAPNNLVNYVPCDGVNSPEPDIIQGNATVSGTRLGISSPPAISPQQVYVSLSDSALTAAAVIAATIAAKQVANSGGINATEVMAASIAAFQQADFGALSLTQVITAALQAFQQNNSAQISAAEVITSTITAWQQSDYASLTIIEVITATLAAAQKSNFAAISTDNAIASAINAYQGPDSGFIDSSQVIAAVIAAKQTSNFALLTDQEIITAMINAFQALDFGTITVPVNVDRAKVALSATKLYSAAINQAALYTAITTAQFPI